MIMIFELLYSFSYYVVMGLTAIACTALLQLAQVKVFPKNEKGSASKAKSGLFLMIAITTLCVALVICDFGLCKLLPEKTDEGFFFLNGGI